MAAAQRYFTNMVLHLVKYIMIFPRHVYKIYMDAIIYTVYCRRAPLSNTIWLTSQLYNSEPRKKHKLIKGKIKEKELQRKKQKHDLKKASSSYVQNCGTRNCKDISNLFAYLEQPLLIASLKF